MPMSSQLQKSGLETLHRTQISDEEEPQASEEVVFGQNSGGVFDTKCCAITQLLSMFSHLFRNRVKI